MRQFDSCLHGRYKILNYDFLDEKSKRLNDPRHKFYIAMLANDTYEAYNADVAHIRAMVPTQKKSPLTGLMEIRYARSSRWIEDV